MPNWKPRSPDTFPARFINVALNAAQYPDEAVLLEDGFKLKHEAKAKAERFRFWRFCVREWPGACRAADAESRFMLKTAIIRGARAGEYAVTVTARHRVVNLLPAGLIDYASI